MGHDHSHGHHHSPREATRRALLWSLVLNGGFLAAEVAVGLATGSLALLSDAAHMVSDVAALMLALGAAHLAGMAASPQRTWGFVRAETLGAFVNGIALLFACGVIFWEAGERLLAGAPPIAAGPVLVTGLLGLFINLGSAFWLYRADRDNINVRAALAHMLADALGSAGATVSALFLARGFYAADAIASLLIGALVLWGTARLLRESGRVLLQFAPAGVRTEQVSGALMAVEGMEEVHHLHLWSLDGQNAILSAHLVAAAGVSPGILRSRAEAALKERFNIADTTFQVESGDGCAHRSCPLMSHLGAGAPGRGHPHDHDHDHDHDPLHHR